jgi:hypothetical protein
MEQLMIGVDHSRLLVSSLRHFHAAFRLFCKKKFAADFLYQVCCYEFDLLSKGSNSLKEYAAVEDTFHYDQEDDDLQSDSQDVDTFDIVSNVSTVLSCHENQIVSFDYSNDKEQIFTKAHTELISNQPIYDN